MRTTGLVRSLTAARNDAAAGAVAALLVYEQSLVCADDLSRLKQAFDLNGYVGVLYLVTTAVAVYVG